MSGSGRELEQEPTFRDHFSKHAPDYATYRPHYPRELFAWLAGLTRSHEIVWDAGAGTGQASIALAEFFARVIATDASSAQIASAEPHERVEYRIAAAESSGLPDGAADLVTAAQSLHWFDVSGFFAEARRVAKPDGIVAVWTYARPGTGDPAIDAPLEQFHENVIAPWWPPERRLVDTGYRTVPFPFAEIDPPPFEMTARWTLRELLGYIGTWSATARRPSSS